MRFLNAYKIKGIRDMNNGLNTVSSNVPFQRTDTQNVESGSTVSNAGSGYGIGRKIVVAAMVVCAVVAAGALGYLAYTLATQNPPQGQPYPDGGEIPWGGRNITDAPPTNHTQQ
jgi:uncharacterized membrane protein YebE (DUF533 family)